jgi:hypothetical protein
MRGNIEQLPPKLIGEAEERYFKPFTQTHLRFLPYIFHLSINNKLLDTAKINEEERQIYLFMKKELEVIVGEITQPIKFIDKEFYDFVCDCLYYAYNNDFKSEE